MPAVDPGPCAWLLPDPREAEPGSDLVGIGADLEPATLIEAYRTGLFPMRVDGGQLGWWSPDPRGILPLDELRVTRSLRASARRFTVTVDLDFDGVIRGCAERPGLTERELWITEEFIAAYSALHAMGWAHSIEVWQDEQLVGGLYGVEVGGLFAGESMFHRVRDASKVALLGLAVRLGECGGFRLLDVQWTTEHLASLGAIDVPREAYLELLDAAVQTPPCLGGPPSVA